MAQALAKRILRALIRDIGSDIVFLFETKIPINRSRKLLESLGFYNIEYVDPKGKKGGLVVCWKIGVDLEVTYKCSNMINVLMFSDPINESWLMSFMYGPSKRSDRGFFWEAVEKVGEAFSGGWLCIGDFNHVFSQADKKGGKLVANLSSRGPNEVIDKNGLIDFKFSGNPFTWSNRREQCRNKRPFKFEEVWTRDESSHFVVEKAWRGDMRGTLMFKVCKKFKETKNEFKLWNRECFGNIQYNIKECWKQLEKIQGEDPTQENLSKEASIYLNL